MNFVRKKWLWAAVLAAGLALPGGAGSAEEGQLPEVIIKGGEKSGVESEKAPLDIELNQDEAVLPDMAVEEELLKRQPESLRNPRAGFAEHLWNDKTVLPARIRLAKDPVKVFYPLREILAVAPALSQEIGTGWELVVTDSDGRSFRKFTGKGLPPGSLPWNGRSDRGAMVRVGKTYSIVINYKDIRGQARNFVGAPFAFDGVLHQEQNGLVISLSMPAVFERKPGTLDKEEISASGMDILREAADWIKRFHFTMPVQVECQTLAANTAQARAQAVAKTLVSLLLLPRPEIPAAGSLGDANSERLDIVIVNR